ncbi:hypothetical protein DNTS_004190 [Danionella cerebrum]|uniref:Dolichyl-diphosphooligosaccharide--protein glycosyltransferase subunit DAD1 n=1 Tax=Danionella cerebrum TaxID=2873325 RepID=A0A553Q8Z7_9TELE|nr:hypothetical protein DNTS_004190 [Danionella translucida]
MFSRFVEEYRSSTPTELKVIDAYLLYILLTGAFQFLYCLPINPQNKGDFLTVSPERAFADFLFAHTILRLIVVYFVG